MTVVDLYTIQIIDGGGASYNDHVRASSLVPRTMTETEENINDLLGPLGYRARIRRWDDFTDEPTQEDDDD